MNNDSPRHDDNQKTASRADDKTANPPRWVLALESSTPYGGSALLRDGKPYAEFILEEGLRHGKELLASAQTLLNNENLRAADLYGVAVSTGPGSYTGIRVGVMAAKALAYGCGCKLAGTSSLAALAQTVALDRAAGEGATVAVVQDARRDEVYMGGYEIVQGVAVPVFDDRAMTPEEAVDAINLLAERGTDLLRAGSSFTTYEDVFAQSPGHGASKGEAGHGGRVNPAAVGVLAWRQFMQEKNADPMVLQPVYARRDPESDWRHDQLIRGTK